MSYATGMLYGILSGEGVRINIRAKNTGYGPSDPMNKLLPVHQWDNVIGSVNPEIQKQMIMRVRSRRFFVTYQVELCVYGDALCQFFERVGAEY